MKQELSAMNYIKNNKRRVCVLVVSLMLCFTVSYLAQFIFSATIETFKMVLVENSKKIQFISLPSSAYNMSGNEENYKEVYKTKVLEFAEKLKKQNGINDVIYAQIIYYRLKAVVGEYGMELPCVGSEEVKILMSHMGAKLKEGHIPENPGEIILDELTMKNIGLKIGDNIYSKDFTIVGISECKTYFACGVRSENDSYQEMLVSLSDGSIKDLTALIKNLTAEFKETDASILDYKYGVEMLKKNVEDVINNSSKIIFLGIIIVLSISLIVVYSMYLRDRHQEWCLYSSIGYSQNKIYFSILREVLISFSAALILGGILIVISMFVLDKTMLQSLGLSCRYFHINILLEILCSYVLIFGLLQIPIRFALYKIRTIDAMEDDLY